jgi:cobalamin 5'-phosphate synthase/cobalamin synthase
VKSLLASIAFCTRIPIRVPFTTEDVGKAARWFPVVGAMLGLLSWGIASVLQSLFPAAVIAVVVVATEALVTGALHFDGLADTFDGFGGGKTREDILRIMRDHAIGTYGAMALISLVALKVTVMTALIEQHRLFPVVLLASVLGRWNVVLLSWWLPYARSSQAVSRNIGRREAIGATLATVLLIGVTRSWHGGLCWAGSGLCAVLFGCFCRKKIDGVTGDTLGASEQLGESVVLLMGLALR